MRLHVCLARARRTTEENNIPFTAYLQLHWVPVSWFLCARTNSRSTIEETLPYHTQVNIYYCHIQSPIPSSTHCKLSKPDLSMSVPAGLWPPVSWACFSARLFPFTVSERIRTLLAFLWSNTEEIAAAPWMGGRTIPGFAVLPKPSEASAPPPRGNFRATVWSYMLLWGLLLLFQISRLYTLLVVYFYHFIS